jgi:hypothetical protein
VSPIWVDSAEAGPTKPPHAGEHTDAKSAPPGGASSSACCIAASVRGPLDEVHELGRVAQGPAVAKQDEPGLERKQLAGRAAVLDRVGCEEPWRLVEAGDPSEDIHVVEHVAKDENAIRLAPVGHMTRRVAGHLEHPESGHLITLTEDSVYLPAGPAQCRRASRGRGGPAEPSRSAQDSPQRLRRVRRPRTGSRTPRTPALSCLGGRGGHG